MVASDVVERNPSVSQRFENALVDEHRLNRSSRVVENIADVNDRVNLLFNPIFGGRNERAERINLLARTRMHRSTNVCVTNHQKLGALFGGPERFDTGSLAWGELEVISIATFLHAALRDAVLMCLFPVDRDLSTFVVDESDRFSGGVD